MALRHSGVRTAAVLDLHGDIDVLAGTYVAKPTPLETRSVQTRVED
jgi:hypothetical protein